MANIKPVPGFQGLYEAHEFGFIISCEKTWVGGVGGNILRHKPRTCLKPARDRYGYLKTTLMKDGRPHYVTIHRIIAQAFIPNPDGLPQVNHKDGNKANNAVSNLEWVTDKQNKRHAWDVGLKVPSPQKTGATNIKSKLTDEQAEDIRQSAESCRALAAKYDVHHSIIGGIKKGTRYPKTDQ